MCLLHPDTHLASHLIYALQAADDQLLEVQLRCYPHVQLHVELVVVRLERPGGSSSGDLVHHGRLHLQEVAVVEVFADVLDDLGAGDEGAAGRVVHDEVEEAVAVALLLVFISEMLARTWNYKLYCYTEVWATYSMRKQGVRRMTSRAKIESSPSPPCSTKSVYILHTARTRTHFLG
jgi:hypothetical protein